MKIRVGTGYDVHRLGENLPLTVGGVKIEHTHGLIAHSDGDVLIHALADALLGAAALGDIGKHFPDNNDDYKGIDSRILLKRVCELIRGEGYEISNADCTIIAQLPKFAPYIDAMRKELAVTMGVEINQINVKATTTEKLGFEGRKEGISAMCSALLISK